MAAQSPRGSNNKKAAQSSLKDKRAQKREKAQESIFKPRKGH